MQGRDVEIAVAGGRRADADALVGEPHMHGVRVGGGMDRDRGDAELLGGAQDAQGDFAPVGDEDLVEHSPLLDDEERFAVFDRRAVLDIDRRDGAGAGRHDLVEGLHGLDEQNLVAGLDLRADLDEVSCLRARACDRRCRPSATRTAPGWRGRGLAAGARPRRGGGATTAAAARGGRSGHGPERRSTMRATRMRRSPFSTSISRQIRIGDQRSPIRARDRDRKGCLWP